MFELTPKGVQRKNQPEWRRRQAVPELGSGDWEGLAADCRQHISRSLLQFRPFRIVEFEKDNSSR